MDSGGAYAARRASAVLGWLNCSFHRRKVPQRRSQAWRRSPKEVDRRSNLSLVLRIGLAGRRFVHRRNACLRKETRMSADRALACHASCRHAASDPRRPCVSLASGQRRATDGRGVRAFERRRVRRQLAGQPVLPSGRDGGQRTASPDRRGRRGGLRDPSRSFAK
jgi:hypothetical protein